MKLPAASRQSPALGGVGLTVMMLLVPLVGSLAGVVRAVLLEGAGQWRLAFWVLPLLGPITVVAALAVWVGRRRPAAGWWGGLAAALVAAVYNFVALHPEVNRDANIGVGIHIMLGWLFPLGPAFLIGAGLGLLVEKWRGVSPSPPLPPWKTLSPCPRCGPGCGRWWCLRSRGWRWLYSRLYGWGGRGMWETLSVCCWP